MKIKTCTSQFKCHDCKKMVGRGQKYYAGKYQKFCKPCGEKHKEMDRADYK